MNKAKYCSLIWLILIFFNSQLFSGIDSQKHRREIGIYNEKKNQKTMNLKWVIRSNFDPALALPFLVLLLVAPNQTLAESNKTFLQNKISSNLDHSFSAGNSTKIPLSNLAYPFLQASPTNTTIHQRRTPMHYVDFEEVVETTKAHKRGLRGENMKILMIDSVLPDPDSLTKLKVNFANGREIGGEHATHIAGIIETIAPRTRLIASVIARENGHIEDFNTAIMVAEELKNQGTRLDAISYSMGLQLNWNDYQQFQDIELIKNLNNLTDNGVAIFFAFGNDWNLRDIRNRDYYRELVHFVNRHDFSGLVRIVGNLAYFHDENNYAPLEQIWHTSNRCTEDLDCKYVFFAPGTEIWSTLPNNREGGMTGTSMATPIAVGIYALLREAYPENSPVEILNLMGESARKTTLNGEVLGPEFGMGIIHFERAFTLAHQKGWKEKETSSP